MNNKNDIPSSNLQKLIDIGRSLSREKNINILLEKILIESRNISNSDGGTLYLLKNDDLKFEIMHTESKNAYFGGSAQPVPDSTYPVKLYKDNKPNMSQVSAACALTGKTINIKDAYSDKEYDLSGLKGFDTRTDYYSKALLNVPLKNHKDEVIGVLQLINPMNKKEIVHYTNEMIDLVESLASQASIALTNQLLINEQKELFQSFIQLVSEALDRKDKVTGGHCTRVPILTMMIADAINNDKKGKYKNFLFSDDEMEELSIAGWLHDFGKVATPEYVMNKSTKLEGLFDKINFIRLKFEIYKRDLKIKYYESISNVKNQDLLQQKKIILKEKLTEIDMDVKFLEKCNVGGEFMSRDMQEKVSELAKKTIYVLDKESNILSPFEEKNLKIEKGTLNNEDRKIMEEHVSLSYELLNKLPYPKHLQQVPFYAGCHHEKIDGSGYPNGYKGNKLPLQARIIAIADVFEGLTAPDRPYKKGYKLSKAIKILNSMVEDNEIDADLFNLFLDKKVYLKYAKKHVDSSQIDSI